MLYLIATAHTLGVRLTGRIDQRLAALRADRERGSVTLEQVIVGALLAGIAVVAFAIIKSKVEAKANGIP